MSTYRLFTMRFAIFLLFVCLTWSTSTAQIYDEYSDEELIDQDFTFEGLEQDSIVKVDNSKDPSGLKAIFSGKPGKAALYSLMVPGWGQVYNGKIWKLPLVYGLEGAAIYYLITNARRYNDFNACYTSLVTTQQPIAECRGVSTVNDAFVIRQAYRKRRELSYVFVIGAHLFQAFEAFIDRHLVDFDLDEDLSFKPFVQPDHTRSELHLAGIYFNLSPKRNKVIPKF